MMEKILKIITTGTIDGDDKLLTALFLNFIFSVIIFIVSKLIYSLRNEKNVLELNDYNIFWKMFGWSIGSVLVCYLLLICNLMTYSIFSILIVAFAWDTLFIKMKKNAMNNDGIGDELKSIKK